MTKIPLCNPTIRISSDIFNLFPQYRRGLVIAHQLVNETSPEELVDLLRAEEVHLRKELAGKDLNTISRLESWREAFRMTGIKPTKFRPSIDALARRVVSGNDLPSINILVDIGNLISLRYLVPVGAHAIDVLLQGMELKRATGCEDFIPFGSDILEHPEAGEIIFTDGHQVMTRRWAWRQAEHTLVQKSTTAVEYNIDLLPPLTGEIQEEISNSVKDLVQKYCGGQIRYSGLSADIPEVSLITLDIS